MTLACRYSDKSAAFLPFPLPLCGHLYRYTMLVQVSESTRERVETGGGSKIDARSAPTTAYGTPKKARVKCTNRAAYRFRWTSTLRERSWKTLTYGSR